MGHGQAGLASPVGDGRPAGNGLDAAGGQDPALGTTLPHAGAGHLIGEAVGALVDFFVHHEARAQACGDGQELDVALVPALAHHGFRQGRQVGVIFQGHRQPRAGGQLVHQGVAEPPGVQVGGDDDLALLQIQGTGTGDADAGEVLPFQGVDGLGDLPDGRHGILRRCGELDPFQQVHVLVHQGDPGVGPAHIDANCVFHVFSSDSLFVGIIIGFPRPKVHGPVIFPPFCEKCVSFGEDLQSGMKTWYNRK